jgi:hypothetical protein
MGSRAKKRGSSSQSCRSLTRELFLQSCKPRRLVVHPRDDLPRSDVHREALIVRFLSALL